jgi:PAS domain S-box-containing protein
VKRSSEHTEYLNSEGAGSQLERVRSALAVDINAESWLETLLSTVPDLVYLIDAEGRWEFVNESALALYELQGIDYRGKTLPQLAELAPAYKEAFAACQRSDDSAWARRTLTRTEEKIVQTDGNELMIDLIRVPLFHDDGSRKAMVIVGRDMTEVRFAESAQRARYRACCFPQTMLSQLCWAIRRRLKSLAAIFSTPFIVTKPNEHDSLNCGTCQTRMHPSKPDGVARTVRRSM